MGALILAGCGLPKIIVIDDPLTPEEHLQLGMAYEKQGKLRLALQEYGYAAEKFPLAYHLTGNVHFQLGDYHAAETAYRLAVRKLPDHPDPHNNLAWLLYALNKNLDEAETLARRAIDLAPEAKKAAYRDTLEKILKLKSRLGGADD